MLYVKLGGSLITYKKEGMLSVKEDVVRSISRELSLSLRDKIFLAHGAGSFGHIPVMKYNLQDGLRKGSELGASEVMVRVSELNSIIAKILLEEHVPVAPFPARSIFMRRGGKISCNTAFIKHLIDYDLIPLTHGDLIPDEESGTYVLSADEMPLYLVPLGLKKVIFLTDVPGVLDDEGNLIKELKRGHLPELKKEGFDVTGAMEGKLSHAFKLTSMGVEVIIAGYINDGDLKKAIEGEWGTKII